MRRKTLLSRVFFTVCALCLSLRLEAADPRTSAYPTEGRLFHISRSVNRNLVCYDVRLTADGQLDTEDPVKVYWVNREEHPGETNGLNYFQRKMAYGYKLDRVADEGCYISLTAYPDRSLLLRREKGHYVCALLIGGRAGILRELYVKASPHNPLSVEYVELRGESLEDGSALTERINR